MRNASILPALLLTLIPYLATNIRAATIAPGQLWPDADGVHLNAHCCGEPYVHPKFSPSRK